MRRIQFHMFLSVLFFTSGLFAQQTMQQQVRLDPGTTRILPEVGFVLQQPEGAPQPKVFLIINENGPKGATFMLGDAILAINKKSVTSLKDFDKAYEKVKVGDHAEFEIEREGKKMTLKFTKPKSVSLGPVQMQRTQ